MNEKTKLLIALLIAIITVQWAQIWLDNQSTAVLLQVDQISCDPGLPVRPETDREDNRA
jgi:hypothetical protein